MKLHLSLLTTALLLTGASAAFAASSTDLTVTGIITPSSCTPSLANGGVVDYGKISAKSLNASVTTELPTQTVQLTLTCNSPTSVALETEDNRKDSSMFDQPGEFGLGLINGTEKLGSMAVALITTVADGVSVRAIVSGDDGSTWIADRQLKSENIISVADLSSLTPKPVQLLTSELIIYPVIAPTNQLTLTNEVSIDGSLTLTVRYL